MMLFLHENKTSENTKTNRYENERTILTYTMFKNIDKIMS